MAATERCPQCGHLMIELASADGPPQCSACVRIVRRTGSRRAYTPSIFTLESGVEIAAGVQYVHGGPNKVYAHGSPGGEEIAARLLVQMRRHPATDSGYLLERLASLEAGQPL